MRFGQSDCPRGHSGAVSATTLASHFAVHVPVSAAFCMSQLLVGGGPTEYTMRNRVA